MTKREGAGKSDDIKAIEERRGPGGYKRSTYFTKMVNSNTTNTTTIRGPNKV